MKLDSIALEEPTKKGIHPQLFALWIGMASIIMMFTGLTSAYIVKSSAGNWLEFSLPKMFYISTATIILSSIVLHLSYYGYKNQKELLYKGGLVLTFVLGILFVVFQIAGWNQLYSIGVDFKANVAGSFTYLLTGTHAVHILGGIAALIVAMVHAFTLRFRYTEKRKNRFRLIVHYWHFVDLLWIYLLIFMTTK